MADPYLYIESTGVIVPDTETILAENQAEYRAVFGEDLVVDASTPQGALITADTLARTETVQNNAQVANQINPNVADGVFLDAIMALTGMQRTPATRTLVPGVELAGIAGTIIPEGTQASTASGDVFASLSTVVLDGSGEATVDFAAVEYGPISCGIGALTQVVTGVLGWETVTNPVAGTLGANTQSDQAARAMRRNTLGFQGVALPVAITSALYNVEGVRSLHFQENVAATTQVINGISMVSHSIYVCVQGGSDLDVAAALLENKSSGCAWVGGTTIDVVEPASGQEYAVSFARPTEIGILIKVTTPNGPTDDIKTAILAYVNGELEGEDGFVVGGDVSPFELAGAINRAYPAIFVSKVEISLESPVSYTTDVIAIEVDEVAVTEDAFITVVTA